MIDEMNENIAELVQVKKDLDFNVHVEMKNNVKMRRERAAFFEVTKKIKKTALDEQERGDEY